MKSANDLADLEIAFLGLGLMGGSLAWALRGSGARLTGYDPDETAVRYATRHRLVDYASTRPDRQLARSEVVILAAPVKKNIELIGLLPELHSGNPVVIDLSSTKVEITEALAGLPARFDPVGGHPMCGREVLSIANAIPTLFEGATFAFTSLPRTTPKARAIANQIASRIGANPLWITPDMHDRWTAATSHLPFLVSSILTLVAPIESAPLAGSGFRSSTRLAETPSSMMLEVIETNQANILTALRAFKKQLAQMEDLILQNDFSELKSLLDRGREKRGNMTNQNDRSFP